MAILRGRDGTAFVPNSVTVFTSEATTEVAYVYQIDAVAKRIWDPNTTVIVSDMAGVLDQTWYKDGVDYFTGRVKATSTGDAALAVSGAYVNSVTAVAAIYGWSINVTRNIAETTPLGEAWRDITALGAQTTVTLSRYRTDAQFDHLASTPFVMLQLEEESGNGWWVLAPRTALNWTKAVGTVDQESVTLEAVGQITRY